jgi:hypothetical protein
MIICVSILFNLWIFLESTDSVNLFCCFRWMLICFKREFSYQDISILWEAYWSCPLTQHYELFISLAILNKYRQEIMLQCTAFDETLKVTIMNPSRVVCQ